MYLKTTYRNHCEEDDSKCADHCRVFALSYAGDTEVQKVCSHSHNVKCEDCEMLKSVLEEVKGAISECLNPTQCNWVGFNALNLVAMKILRRRPTLTSI